MDRNSELGLEMPLMERQKTGSELFKSLMGELWTNSQDGLILTKEEMVQALTKIIISTSVELSRVVRGQNNLPITRAEITSHRVIGKIGTQRLNHIHKLIAKAKTADGKQYFSKQQEALILEALYESSNDPQVREFPDQVEAIKKFLD